MSLLNTIAARSIGAILLATVAIGLANTVNAQEPRARGLAEMPSRKPSAPPDVGEDQKPCDKDSAFCPVRPCSAKSVLCIDASNNVVDDDEESYRALIDTKNAEQVKLLFDNAHDKAEFYTFVNVKNDFEDGNIIAACANHKTGSFTIANIAIDYKGPKGSSAVSFVPLSTLFIHANSVDVGKNATTPGCTFKSASHQAGPYLLYSGPAQDQQEYTLHLKTTAGVVPSTTHFAMFAKLASSAAAVWPGFIAISQPAGALVNTVAADLDALSAEASVTSNIEYSAVLTAEKQERKDAGRRLQVWSPRLGEKRNSGYMEISQGRSASIVMDANAQHDWITPDDVLSNTGLGSPHRCILGTASCDKEQSFSRALNADFELYGDFQTARATPQPGEVASNEDTRSTSRASQSGGTSWIKSGSENWETVFQTCEKIRTTADDLGLTPINSLLVRWALLQRATLIDVLRDYQSGKLKGGVENGLKAASRVGMDEPYKQCWDANVDDRRMHAVEALMNKAKFSPAIP